MILKGILKTYMLRKYKYSSSQDRICICHQFRDVRHLSAIGKVSYYILSYNVSDFDKEDIIKIIKIFYQKNDQLSY